MEYQAHVFWNNDADQLLALNMRKILASLDCRLGSIDQTNYCFIYHERVKKVVENYLKNNHGDLSILIHETSENTKNCMLDARWIGTPIV